jgi:hypothetical protein
LWLGVANCV